jgi:uncharacterized protein (DUF58 family)
MLNQKRWQWVGVVLLSLSTVVAVFAMPPALFLGLAVAALVAFLALRKKGASTQGTGPTAFSTRTLSFLRQIGFLASATPERSARLIPTPRLLLLLLSPAPFLAVSGAIPALLYVGLGLLIATMALVVADMRISPHPADFAVERVHDDKFSQWAKNRVEVIVRSRAAHAVDVQVRDEPPVQFAVETSEHIFRTHLEEHGQVALVYPIYPPRRGDYAFGNLNLRWTSALGLLIFQATCAAETPVKVYPNLFNMRQYESLIRRRQAEQIGLRIARYYGEGSEFGQLRDYLPDDDYRRISWKATARRGRPITVEFQAERNQNIMLLIDAGQRMMARGSADVMSRIDYVVNAVLLISYIAASKGDRVGVLTFADEVLRYLPPRSGHGQFCRIMEMLYGVEAQPIEPNYARALGYLRTQRQKRSLIVLFTEISSSEQAPLLIPHLSALYPHHLPLCVTLNDRALLAISRRKLGSVRDVYERVAAEWLLDDRQIWLDELNRHGVLTLDVLSGELTPAVINKYLEIKGQSRI